MSRPTLKLLQTPAKPGAASFDGSRPAPQTDALRHTWWAGHSHGFRDGWVKGVRWGMACGFSTTLCVAILLTALAAGLGWL